MIISNVSSFYRNLNNFVLDFPYLKDGLLEREHETQYYIWEINEELLEAEQNARRTGSKEDCDDVKTLKFQRELFIALCNFIEFAWGWKED